MSLHRLRLLFPLVLALFFLLTACSVLATPPPPLPQTPTSDLSALTPLPTSSPTAGLSSQGTPVAAPTPTPDHLTSGGPWLVYASGGGTLLEAVNSDGSGHMAIPADALLNASDLSDGASPHGGWLAVRTQGSQPGDLALQILHLPDGTLKTITPLFSPDLQRLANTTAQDALPEVFYAVLQPHTLSWSPDGRYLAFVAAVEGPSSDLYVYDTHTGQIRRLTNGVKQVATPLWSPDSLWVVIQEAESFGPDADIRTDAVWAVAVDHSEMRKLYVPPADSLGEVFLGWASSGELLSYSRNPVGGQALRQVPLNTRFVDVLFSRPFLSIAYDSASQTLVFTEGQGTAVHSLLPEGIYLLPASADKSAQATQVRAGQWNGVEWAPSLGRFLANGMSGLLLVAPDGSATWIKGEGQGAASPDGQWLVCWGGNDSPGVRLYNPGGQMLQEVSAQVAQQVSWRPDASGFFFLTGERLYIASFPQALPALIDGQLQPGDQEGMTWMEP